MYNKNSITIADEKNRKSGQTLSRSYFHNNRKYGVVKDIHPSFYAITIQLQEGGMAQNGRFIPVTNAWQQLIHDFGNLRPGLLVELRYIGDQESIAEARIIGLEGEDISQQQEQPEVNLTLYEIFAPGL